MKDYYNDIFNLVVTKGDERIKRKKIIMSRIKNCAIAVSGLCAAVIVGVSIWNNDSLRNAIKRNNEQTMIIEESEIPTEQIDVTTASATDAPTLQTTTTTAENHSNSSAQTTTVTTDSSDNAALTTTVTADSSDNAVQTSTVSAEFPVTQTTVTTAPVHTTTTVSTQKTTSVKTVQTTASSTSTAEIPDTTSKITTTRTTPQVIFTKTTTTTPYYPDSPGYPDYTTTTTYVIDDITTTTTHDDDSQICITSLTKPKPPTPVTTSTTNDDICDTPQHPTSPTTPIRLYNPNKSIIGTLFSQIDINEYQNYELTSTEDYHSNVGDKIKELDIIQRNPITGTTYIVTVEVYSFEYPFSSESVNDKILVKFGNGETYYMYNPMTQNAFSLTRNNSATSYGSTYYLRYPPNPDSQDYRQ